MCWTKMARISGTFYVPELAPINMVSWRHTPAWSLHRLIEMMPEEMYGGLLCVFKDSIRYEELIMDRPEAHFEVVGDDMYENAISCIEWLIKEDYFNKDYLEDKK